MNNGPDNEIYGAILAGTILFSVFAVFIVLFLRHYHLSQIRFQHEREALKNVALQAEIEIREQTLSDVSTELHDNLGQVASLIKINLNLLSKELSNDDQQKVDESITLLKQLITDIKMLSQSLNGENLARTGLIAALENLVASINKTGGPKITFITSNNIDPLSRELEVFLFRMSQEMLHNILKHAEASEASITLLQHENRLTLECADNGRGFKVPETEDAQGKGAGLKNLSKRCRMIGANLAINSVIGKGTKVIISLTHPTYAGQS